MHGSIRLRAAGGYAADAGGRWTVERFRHLRGGEEKRLRPRNPAELELARIWAEVLNVERVGVEDDFFELEATRSSRCKWPRASERRSKWSCRWCSFRDHHRQTGRGAAGGLGRASGRDRRRSSPAKPYSTRYHRHGEREAGCISGGRFLTGCTGFLGAFLCTSSLRRRGRTFTASFARRASRKAGREFRRSSDRSPSGEDGKSSRIVPVPAISRVPTSACRPPFDKLASETVIYHCGAVVNAIYPYSVHKPANVLGTRGLAVGESSGVKPVHYPCTGVVPWTTTWVRFPEELGTRRYPLAERRLFAEQMGSGKDGGGSAIQGSTGLHLPAGSASAGTADRGFEQQRPVLEAAEDLHQLGRAPPPGILRH
jgi:hypothetical protein